MTGAPSDGVILVGQSVAFVAVPRDAAGNALSRTVNWTSSNQAVLTVSSTGVVSALSVGSATVIAVADGTAASVEMVVRVAIQTPAVGATQPVTSSVLSGAVTLTIPPAAVSAGSILSVAPAVPASLPTSAELVAGTAFNFGPDGTQFATPVMLSLLFDPANVPLSERSGLAIYLSKNGDWEEVAGSVLDASSNRVTAPVLHFSTYALLRRPAAADVAVAAGNNQSALAGTALTISPSVRVTDSRGRGVPLVAVTFAVTGGAGSVVGGAQVTNASGVATVGGWTLGAAGLNTLTASVGTLVPTTFTATATQPTSVASNVAKYQGDGQSADAGTTVTTPPSVKVLDQLGTPMAGVAVTFAVASGGGSVTGATAISASNGVAAVGGWTLGAGNNTLTATVQGLTPVTFAAFGRQVVAPGVPTRLSVTTQPAVAYTGAPFVIQPVVEILDGLGSRVTSATSPVTAAILNGSGTLLGQATVNAVNGVATFTSLAIQGAGTFSLIFASGTLVTAVSNSFQVTVVPTHMSVVTQPACASTGLAFATQPVVDILDASNVRVPFATNVVTASLSTGTGVLSGHTSVAAVDGRVSFSDLSIAGTGAYALSFASPALPAIASASFVVTTLPCGQQQGATQLVMTSQPSTMVSGTSTGNFTVEARDANGNLDTHFNSTATISIATGSGALYGGNRTVNLMAGIAQFNGVRVDGHGNHTFIVATPSLSSVTSATVSVTQIARAVVLTQPPLATQSGVLLTTQPIVTISDDAGLAVFGNTDSVLVSVFFTSTGVGRITGTTTVRAVNGVVNYTDLSIIGGGDFNLNFFAPDVHASVSYAFTMPAGAQTPTQLVMTVGPTVATSGGSLWNDQAIRPVTFEIRDAFGLIVSDYSGVVVASVDSGTATLTQGTSATAVQGVVTFPSLSAAGLAGKLKLRFTAPGLPSVVSGTVVITQ
ncbi:MAG: Ig-like domain-containing protein, partial [bacterium]